MADLVQGETTVPQKQDSPVKETMADMVQGEATVLHKTGFPSQGNNG